jgi:methyltransferase (TIGR00027 family)
MSKRIESKTSKTAEFTCMIRCLSYLERRTQYRSDDSVSFIIMNSMIKLLIRFPFVRVFIIKGFPWGMYEYVISRTKYIDEAFETALEDETKQILFLGAGFDSRGIRFYEKAKNIRIFEIDAPVTQSTKLKRYKEEGISIPGNLIFVPVDFNRQSIFDRLLECGFERDKKSLVIMEGLTMYLPPESIDSLFRTIQSLTAEGSRIVFDFIYTSVLKHENRYRGEKELLEATSKNGESFSFGLDKNAVPEFLCKYSFKVSDIADNTVLENRYFKDDSGKQTVKMSGTHCIVSATRVF